MDLRRLRRHGRLLLEELGYTTNRRGLSRIMSGGVESGEMKMVRVFLVGGRKLDAQRARWDRFNLGKNRIGMDSSPEPVIHAELLCRAFRTDAKRPDVHFYVAIAPRHVGFEGWPRLGDEGEAPAFQERMGEDPLAKRDFKAVVRSMVEAGYLVT